MRNTQLLTRFFLAVLLCLSLPACLPTGGSSGDNAEVEDPIDEGDDDDDDDDDE